MLTWSDEFTDPAGSPADPAYWTAYTNGNGNGNAELEYYLPDAVACTGDGKLQITANPSTAYAAQYSVSRYTSGKISTKGKVEFRYGHLVVNAAVPCGGQLGAWPAIWLLGANDSFVTWPGCGEIDVMESFGVHQSPLEVSSSTHTGQSFTKTMQLPAGNGIASPHDYELMWSRDEVAFAVDGNVYHTVTRAQESNWLFDEPYYLIINLAIGGTMGGVPPAGASFPYTMQVNSVHLYDAELTKG